METNIGMETVAALQYRESLQKSKTARNLQTENAPRLSFKQQGAFFMVYFSLSPSTSLRISCSFARGYS